MKGFEKGNDEDECEEINSLSNIRKVRARIAKESFKFNSERA